MKEHVNSQSSQGGRGLVIEKPCGEEDNITDVLCIPTIPCRDLGGVCYPG